MDIYIYIYDYLSVEIKSYQSNNLNFCEGTCPIDEGLHLYNYYSNQIKK